MPFYEYSCAGCGEIFEVLQRIGAGEEGMQCPKCGETDCKRLMSVSALSGMSEDVPSRKAGGCVPRGGFS
jgi:putative FmdB family regulatory protein